MRCRRCGSEIKPELTICPGCGAPVRHWRLWPGTMHCRACRARVPSGLTVCPHCGQDLRRSWRSLLVTLALGASLLTLAYQLTHHVPWAELRALSERISLPRVALLATPTFTRVPTPVRSATATLTLVPTPTITETPLPPTETPTAPPPTATQAPVPTPTATLHFAQPQLLDPGNESEFHGRGSQIELAWQAAGLLAEDEWYALSLRFLAGGVVQYSGTWTKETSWIVPLEVYSRAGQVEREFQWDVTVMKETGTTPDGGRDGIPQSATSEARVFSWY